MVNLFKKGFIYLTLMLLVLISVSVESASAAEAVDYEEGVSNLNNTPENSAVVGSSLKKPEIGWKRYDDKNPALKYTGNWINDSRTDLYLDSASLTYDLKSTVKFSFKGKSIRLIGFGFTNKTTKGKVEIDGSIEYFNEKRNVLPQMLIYEKTDLEDTIHTVEIGFENAQLYIDAIDVDGFLINPNEESISLDKNNIELFEGNTEKLTATVTPNSANVIWTSSDESIATVDQNGNVTAIKEGVVTVTAKVENTNLSADCVVTVKKQGSTELESITLDKASLELLEGSQDKLTATVSPDTAKIIWTSSDESIATVDQNGNVTAIREGTAIITATIENTDISATSTVIVKKPNNDFSSAILSITLVNGITKEYDVTNAVLNNYLNWFDTAQGTSTFKFSKTISPYKKVTEYVVHDKIASFEVREY
ncbi:Ig-like domain-containing protein [Lysinibacillus pakistanensis]|uniref:Ig-like domain-containing protein n=1 Tax=Lysinibacillus pakistanensis TaxID=759811 RepID=A0AAX3WW58_9BACI|nr:Ig-like domain-containing protein [Lysinibacillus pakistanensis]MDM5231498.1 Ig-like domain-containing protein [Lysinibacillus pakistanensis]WHY47045.1 Ig-like domain-containing protein [Lysinibacillus pakistanensis]WHY52056.1 Ig-like domain-containing protein [Lysinibacillus pakistanensis]